ncbi:hypothetical protein EJ03DRAFT_335856 [Teratosphaeria nubilosa]|uniref:Secreted protein n=1 Tax=Teratosphaeria nubilosa TaxID=161662 RepID=A0A6G1LAP6_9PEZI|nr:hypothetical protein EJ03DRAFT_335856 [Teratosphaeria nubilosa]
MKLASLALLAVFTLQASARCKYCWDGGFFEVASVDDNSNCQKARLKYKTFFGDKSDTGDGKVCNGLGLQSGYVFTISGAIQASRRGRSLGTRKPAYIACEQATKQLSMWVIASMDIQSSNDCCSILLGSVHHHMPGSHAFMLPPHLRRGRSKAFIHQKHLSVGTCRQKFLRGLEVLAIT